MIERVAHVIGAGEGGGIMHTNSFNWKRRGIVHFGNRRDCSITTYRKRTRFVYVGWIKLAKVGYNGCLL
jgi:hypothetical protein